MSVAKAARRRLRGQWGKAIFAQASIASARLLLLTGEWLLWRKYTADDTLQRGIVTAAALLAELFLLSPLLIGRAALFDQIAAATLPPLSMLFGAYRRRHWMRAVRWRAVYWMVCVGTAATCGIPAMLFTTFCRRLSGAAAADTILTWLFCEGLQAMLWILCALTWGVWLLRYVSVPYLLAADETLSVRRAFAIGRRQMHGAVNATAEAIFYLFPLLAACLTLFPLVYAAPLYRMTLTLRVRALPAASAYSVSVRRKPIPIKMPVDNV